MLDEKDKLQIKLWQAEACLELGKWDLANEDDYVSKASKHQHSFRKLEIGDFIFGFIILIIGLIFSGLALALEVVYRRKVPTKKVTYQPPSP